MVSSLIIAILALRATLLNRIIWAEQRRMKLVIGSICATHGAMTNVAMTIAAIHPLSMPRIMAAQMRPRVRVMA